jgi:hypothetical protein
MLAQIPDKKDLDAEDGKEKGISDTNHELKILGCQHFEQLVCQNTRRHIVGTKKFSIDVHCRSYS